MHKTRKEASVKLPILKKGSKYIARASSNPNNSVPVVIAVRDMLRLAKNAKEVRKMIHQKLLKINGREVKEYGQSIQLFNIFQADKAYELTLSKAKKFVFIPAKNKDVRLCKVTAKRLVRGNAVQVTLHDGTNIITKENVTVGDTIYLDSKNKVSKLVTLDKAKKGFVISGKYMGNEVSIDSYSEGKVKVKTEELSAILNAKSVVAL